MQTVQTKRYAQCLETSNRIGWQIDRDVIRGRAFDFSKTFLPAGLTRLESLAFLSGDDRRLLSQIQGRTYANIFGLVERFINTKVLELTTEYRLGDQIALEALVRFSSEELKHQELFRRIEAMIGRGMPGGYRFLPEPDAVAGVVLGKSTWSVLALTCLIELFTQTHYRQSIDPDPTLSELYKDVFLFHWKEESQHAILDELEWEREDAKLSPEAREAAIGDLIELVGAVDGILQLQSEADIDYFLAIAPRRFGASEVARLRWGMLQAYRWQYILSGVAEPRFGKILARLTTESQRARIQQALAPIVDAAGADPGDRPGLQAA